MRDERGDWTFGPIIGLVIVVLAIIGFFAVCTGGNDDSRSLGRSLVAYHDGGDCDWDGDCGGGGYDDGRGGDGGYSGGHQGYGGGGGRSGDYDGGDGDGDRCRNICNNTFPIAPTPGDRGGNQRV